MTVIAPAVTEAIPARRLRVGDKIVTKINHDGLAVAYTLVKTVGECAGKWRTHLHVNDQDCYDERLSVQVIR